LAATAAKYEELKGLGAEVLAISVDTVFSHKVWHETSPLIQKVKYPLLADPTAEVSRSYEVYDEGAGVALRGRFIIDPDGVIQAMEVLPPSVGRNVDELIRQLKAFQHVRQTGEVTPAGWEPGKPTLKPSLKLAGKV